MPRRTGISSEDTRQQLLDATLRVLLARGYAGTRVSEIAKEAGVTSGAIYNHFSSKAELLSAAINEQAPDAIAQLLASGDGTAVVDAFRAAAALLPEHAQTVGSLVAELVALSTRDQEVAALVRPQFEARETATADAIRLGQEGGAVDPTLDAEVLARLTTVVALGSLVAGALGLKTLDATAWQHAVDRLLDATRPPAAQP